MTRHTAYSLHADGTTYRHPFATFPHADAARRWLANHPHESNQVRFVPALPAEDDDDTLGPCGCTDYHMADCPTRTGGTGRTAEDWYARLSRPGYDPYYDEDDA